MLKHQRYQQDVAERHAWYSKIHPCSWSENGPEIRLDCGVIGPKVANLFSFCHRQSAFPSADMSSAIFWSDSWEYDYAWDLAGWNFRTWRWFTWSSLWSPLFFMCLQDLPHITWPFTIQLFDPSLFLIALFSNLSFLLLPHGSTS